MYNKAPSIPYILVYNVHQCLAISFTKFATHRFAPVGEHEVVVIPLVKLRRQLAELLLVGAARVAER